MCCGWAGAVRREVAVLVGQGRVGHGRSLAVDGMHAALITSAVTLVVDPVDPPPHWNNFLVWSATSDDP